MHARVRLVLIGVFACAFAALAGVWVAAFAHRGDSRSASAAGFYGAVRPAAAHVPRFALSDQDGKRVTDASLRGHATVYAFIYSHCRDICPLEVQQIRGALDRLGHDVPVVGVSVDPANDTRDSARAFLIKQQMTGRMRFLLGSRQQLAPLWAAFGIAPQTKGLDHSAYVVLVDARGHQRLGYPESELTSSDLASDLAKLS